MGRGGGKGSDRMHVLSDELILIGGGDGGNGVCGGRGYNLCSGVDPNKLTMNYLLEPHSSEPLKPLAKGLYFILSCVTCTAERRDTYKKIRTLQI